MARHFFVGRREGEGTACQRAGCARAWDDEVHLSPTSDRAAVTFFGWYVREPVERDELGLPSGLVAERPMSDRAVRRRERTSAWRREFHEAFRERVREAAARQARAEVRRRRAGSSPK